MRTSPQVIPVSRDGAVHEATLTWRRDESWHWAVAIASPAFDAVEARADDAFEALCLVRDELEPQGWRIGVAGAQIDVWPSGMARDQGGGLRAYRIGVDRVGALVDTFEPVDPATVTTVAHQRAETDRRLEEIQRSAQRSATRGTWAQRAVRRVVRGLGRDR